MNICSQIWNYTRLVYFLTKLSNSYNLHKDINHEDCLSLIDTIKSQILVCGAICIKFAQWMLPIIENIYINQENPPWFQKLESLYDDCPIHDDSHTYRVYRNEFNQNLTDNYEIIEILGSGSIGQVYKLKHKYENDSYYALKVIHPKVKHQLRLFKLMFRMFFCFPCIRNKLVSLVPVDYLQFISNFQDQINMVHEASNLSHISYNFRSSSMVITPQLIKCSENCLLMTYEPGVMMDTSNISDYEKTKIIYLIYGFIISSQSFFDICHNDLHKGNWKVRKISDNQYSFIVYDFGYCYSMRPRDRPIVKLLTDLFESSDETVDVRDQFIDAVLHFCNDTSDEFKQKVIEYIPPQVRCDPVFLFELTIDICKNTNHIVDSSTIQILIISIQVFKYLVDAHINNIRGFKKDGYRAYRERYLDLCNLYKTYNIFPELTQYMITKLNTLNLEINGLFDVVQYNETVTDEVKHLLSFD